MYFFFSKNPDPPLNIPSHPKLNPESAIAKKKQSMLKVKIISVSMLKTEKLVIRVENRNEKFTDKSTKRNCTFGLDPLLFCLTVHYTNLDAKVYEKIIFSTDQKRYLVILS